MCEHNIETKVEGGMIITICKKCGKILDSRPIGNQQPTINWNEAGVKDNGGQILHG